MRNDESIEHDQRRIEELIAALDSLDDQRGRDLAKELLHLVLDVHCTGLARLLEIVHGAGEAGRPISESMVLDERVSGLLLLHGLHPQSLEARVKQAVDRLRPQLGAQGIKVELTSVSQEEAMLSLAGGTNGKAIKMAALRQEIERAIFALAPDLGAVRIEGSLETDARVVEVAFIPVSSVGRRAAAR